MLLRRYKMKKIDSSPIVHERFLIPLLHVLKDEDNTFFFQKTLTLMNLVDIDSFANDHTVYVLLKAAKITSESKLNGITNERLIYSDICLNVNNNYLQSVENILSPILLYNTEEELSDEEAALIKKTVLKIVETATILTEIKEVSTILDNITSGNYYDYDSAIDKLRPKITKMKDELDAINDISKRNIVHTSETSFMNAMEEAYNEVTRPTSYLQTGLKYLNEMLHKDGKGFGPKLYIFVALVNSFKTALLMYITKWIKIYNDGKFDDIIKNRKLKPTVVMLQLENEFVEDFDRYYTMFNKKRMVDESIIKVLENCVHSIVDGEIDLTIIHGKPGEYGVRDIINMDKILEIQGYYPIAWCIDYLRLLKDDRNEKDFRLRLGNIAQDLRGAAAVTLKKPIITVHHTNRDADVLIENAKSLGQTNYTKKLGPHVISESKLIEHYADFVAYIAIETPATSTDKYLGFKRGKIRYEASDRNFFVHPLHNGIILNDDVNLPITLSKDSVDSLTENDWFQNVNKSEIKSNNRVNKELNDKIISNNDQINNEPFYSERINIDDSSYYYSYGTETFQSNKIFTDEDIEYIDNEDCCIEYISED